jgi:hypothetical protein
MLVRKERHTEDERVDGITEFSSERALVQLGLVRMRKAKKNNRSVKTLSTFP